MAVSKDYIGQPIIIGDWCAITQNNRIHVGVVVSISKSGAPTITRNSVEEFAFNSKEWRKLNNNWKTNHLARELIINKFPNTAVSPFINLLSYCRDLKFVRIIPSSEMIIKYDI